MLEKYEIKDKYIKSDLKLSIYQDYLSCEALWLRPIFPEDYIPLRACFMNPASMQYWQSGVTYAEKETQDFILNTAKSGWSVITHGGIAGCFWTFKNKTNTDIEIAYVTCPLFSGRGLTTAAGGLILDAKFSFPDFKGKIIATAHPNNKGSQKVLEKLGLEPDPERQNILKFGSVRNFYQKVVKEESMIEPTRKMLIK